MRRLTLMRELLAIAKHRMGKETASSKIDDGDLAAAIQRIANSYCCKFIGRSRHGYVPVSLSSPNAGDRKGEPKQGSAMPLQRDCSPELLGQRAHQL